MYELFLRVTEFVETLGYLGIFIMTFVEGTFIPIPSEITLIPAGYLVAKGTLKLSYVLFFGILGTLFGALFSYGIAFHFGRMLFIKYGKYLFVSDKKLLKLERFVEKYGNISAFTGRLLPGIKHFISFPAGLGKMNFRLFTIYSAAGATIWVLFLVLLGYFIGDNEYLINKYIKQVNIALISLVCIAVLGYLLRYYTSRNTSKKK